MASNPPLEKLQLSGGLRLKRAREYVDDVEDARDEKSLDVGKDISDSTIGNVSVLKRPASSDFEVACEKARKTTSGKNTSHVGGQRCDEGGCERLSKGANGKCGAPSVAAGQSSMGDPVPADNSATEAVGVSAAPPAVAAGQSSMGNPLPPDNSASGAAGSHVAPSVAAGQSSMGNPVPADNGASGAAGSYVAPSVAAGQSSMGNPLPTDKSATRATDFSVPRRQSTL